VIWYDLASLRSDDEDDQPDLEFAFTGGESRAVANPSILWEIETIRGMFKAWSFVVFSMLEKGRKKGEI